MSETILKSHWERVSDHVVVDQQTAQRLLAACLPHQVQSLTLLANGCANTNYKLVLDNGISVVLRIYVRDASALGRETAVNQLVNELLPAPRFLHADASCSIIPYPYAMMEWREGTLLRDLIFTRDEAAITSVLEEAGQYLGLLRKLRLPMGGFFDENLRIQPFALEDEYFGFIMQLLQDKVVVESLGKNLQEGVAQAVTACSNSIPEMNDANLTHGDYDPANILVNEERGVWKISAILDWEFAHAGTYLLDMGLMLRYSHKMPAYVEASFIRGLKDSGTPLPSDWKKQAKLMDLVCLLQLLHANPASMRPAMNRDVVRLITQIVATLPTF